MAFATISLFFGDCDFRSLMNQFQGLQAPIFGRQAMVIET